ncbi:unnamed protein product [Ilex paraguariensis]|uniref:Uncharacterized protein n=1 Tax=Ilex paraguariensis TaxID=185542 RepID=A0ABC8SU81_9AQUA
MGRQVGLYSPSAESGHAATENPTLYALLPIDQDSSSLLGAFVLCRLFKKHDEKQDENVEDEVKQNISSPSVVKSPAEGNHSEPVTPVKGRQVGLYSPSAESGHAASENPTLYALLPIDEDSSCLLVDDTKDKLLDIQSILLDPELE